MNFKKGDRVRDYQGYYQGKVGLIKGFIGLSMARVKFDEFKFDVSVSLKDLRKITKLEKALQ